MSSSSPIFKQAGILCDSAGPAFGNVFVGHGFCSSTGKDRFLVIDSGSLVSGATPASSLANASHAEQYALNSTVAEKALGVVAAIASTAGAVSKIALDVSATTAATGAVYGINAIASVSGTQTGATVYGVQSQVLLPVGTDGSAAGLLSVVYNSGSAVTGLGALSKVALICSSGGTLANSAFIYCTKNNNSTPQNCSHGICVDGASCLTSAIAVTSTTTPTLLWAIAPIGKTIYTAADPTAVANLAAGVTVTKPCGLISVTDGSVAGASTATLAVTCDASLAVTAASRVLVCFNSIDATGTGLVSCGVSAVAANSFTIMVANNSAATNYGARVMKFFYQIMN